MLFKPLLGDQLSGSIGGITASRNRGGSYFRERAVPVNPATPFQVAVRSLFAQLASVWQQTLTDAQRAGWQTYAENTPVVNRIGDVIILPALAMYQRSNVPRLQSGFDRVDEPPSTFGLPEFTPAFAQAVNAPANEAAIGFANSDPWANQDDAAMLVFASRPQSPAVNFFKGPYRLAGSIDGDATTPPASPATIALPFPVVAGQRVFFRVRVVTADGRASTSQRFQGTAI